MITQHIAPPSALLMATVSFASAAIETQPAALVSNELPFEIPESAILWANRVLTLTQAVAFPFALWFKPVVVFTAVSWLMCRAYQVLYKPLEELAGQLGFDIPQTPAIDLAAIRADGVIVHWSLPEKQRQKSKFKFEIYLNGAVVESVPVHESAVTITGLQAGMFYVVRVALVNEQEFGSRSEPIRFRTKPASSGDYFNIANAADAGHETDHDGSAESLPRVKLHRGLKDIVPAAIEAAPMARENSVGLGPKRSIVGQRRPSPAALGLDTQHSSQGEDGEAGEATETVQQLTEKLDFLRRETEEAERLAKEEEEEESRLKDELTVERDALKSEAAEKEKVSRNLKREFHTLERQNTAAQSERSKQERLLTQKQQERQKLKDDVKRWAKETQELQTEAQRMRDCKAERLRLAEEEREKLRQKVAHEASEAKRIEDEIKSQNTEIKRLERALKSSSPDHQDAEPNLVQQMQIDAEEERQWQLHRANLPQQYAGTFQKLEAAKRFHSEQMRYLDSVRAQRRRDDELAQRDVNALQRDPVMQQTPQQMFSSPVSTTTREGVLRRGDSQRSGRAQSGHSVNDSPRMTSFPMAHTGSSQGAFAPGLTSVAGGGAAWNGTPFFNIHNGTLPQGLTGLDTSHGQDIGISDEDRERLTGGAPMSPGAGAELLPADLFSEKDQRPGPVLPLPGLGTLPGLGGMIPGPAAMPSQHSSRPSQHESDREREGRTDFTGPGPASPAASSSRSPSVFASPQASQNNLHIGSPDNTFSNIDSDRRSIRSTRSNRAGTGGAQPSSSRFSSMFGIKPRTKTNPEDETGVPLGKAQSHSMPRQDGIVPGLMDAATRKRNSSISGVFGNDLTHDGASDSMAEAPGASALAGKRRAFGMGSIFGRDKEGGWPNSFTGFGRRPGSPRPGSTHSNELPRPSMDGRWGVDTWPSGDATAGARSSPLSFNTSWGTPGGTSGPRLYGSRHPSRRPSVQYGASGPPEDILEDEDSDSIDDSRAAHLAPIGTKPPPGSKKAMQDDADGTPNANEKKLNPAAKDFKSFFGLKKEKTRGSSPAASASGNATPGPSAATTPQPNSGLRDDFDDSPPLSRKSRDARSMTTTESSIAESGDTGNDLTRTPSYSNSDATGPSPLIGSSGKESFMQKITRKSSSGKFSLPTFNRQKSRLDPSTSMTTAEAEEDDMSASAGSLGGRDSKGGDKEGRDSKEGNRGSGRSWSSVLKRGKGKKGGETPSLSGLSMASGTEDGEDLLEETDEV